MFKLKNREYSVQDCYDFHAAVEKYIELMDGVQEMLGKTDPYFEERFKHMREYGLLDLESRQGKSPGGFLSSLRASKNAFIFAISVRLSRLSLHSFMRWVTLSMPTCNF
jgi:oligoendopeptidase F